MLIVLDQSLFDVITDEYENSTSSELYKNVIGSVEHLARIRRLGRHWIWGEKHILEAFGNSAHLSIISQGVYKYLFSNYPTNKPPRFSKYVRVCSKLEDDLDIKINPNNYNEILVSSRFIHNNLSDISCILLCEDIHDIDFYHIIAQVYQYRHLHDSKILLSINKQAGGGNNISDVYNQIKIDHQNIVLCIVDSDKKYPQGPIGETARRIQTIENNTIFPLSFLYILNVREIENLLPTKFFDSVVSERINPIECYELLDDVATEARYFIDVKDGLKLHDIFQAVNQVDYYNHLRYVASLLDDRINGYDQLTCLIGNQCNTRKECSCTVIPGCGPSILRKVITENLASKSIPRISHEVPPSYYSEWDKIGEIITTWCCGSNPIRS